MRVIISGDNINVTFPLIESLKSRKEGFEKGNLSEKITESNYM